MTNSTINFRSARMGGRVTPVLVAALLTAAVACGTKDATGPFKPSGPTGRVRFVNLITDPARLPVNAILENVPFGVNLAHGGTTPSSLPAPAAAIYAPIYTGSRTLVLKRTADTSVTLATINFTVTANQDQTIYATGGTAGGAVTPVILVDDNTTPAATDVRFRVVNMTTAALDVFITAGGANLATATPTFTALGTSTGSTYVALPAGSYQVRMVPAGTAPAARAANIVVDIPAATYAAGGARTFVAATSATGGSPFKGIVLGDR